ncbi:MAG TPA: biopolymer transporter ExbD [Pirellulales bacterium]|jgi:biopolymer transport protein ExbD|nr:biopolymer transporter ExbD [Pirellulales bacterium]
MIRFPCRQCGKKLKAPDEYAGRQVQCTGCGAVQEVPEPQADTRTQVIESLHIGAAAAPPQHGPVPEDDVPEARLIAPKKGTFDDGLDMTPMVDVTFLLLIFFMVTAAFALQKSIQIPTPDPSEAAAESRTVEELEQDDDNVIVRIDKDNTIWVDDREAPSEQELLSQLKEAREGAPGTSTAGPSKLVVMASGDARHEKVVMALDAGTAAGFDDVRLANGDEDY